MANGGKGWCDENGFIKMDMGIRLSISGRSEKHVREKKYIVRALIVSAYNGHQGEGRFQSWL